MLISKRIVNEVSQGYIDYLIKTNNNYMTIQYIIFDLDIYLKDLEHYTLTQLSFTKTNYARLKQALTNSKKFNDLFIRNIATILQNKKWIVEAQQINIK